MPGEFFISGSVTAKFKFNHKSGDMTLFERSGVDLSMRIRHLSEKSNSNQRVMSGRLAVIFSVLLLCACGSGRADDDIFRDKLISLGTATINGTFHLVGSRLCDQVNQDRSTNLIRCVPYNTVGSAYNAKAVANGGLTMALSSSEVAYTEFMLSESRGTGASQLRAVMSLYAKPIMVLARRDANIADVTQLAGHSINLGNIGSGQRHLVEMLMKTLGLTVRDFNEVSELNASRMGEAFCQGRVDVIVESLGNPSPFYKKMIEDCNGVIVTFPPEVIAKLLAENPLMTQQFIPGGLYRGYAEPVSSFGDVTLLVTNAGVSDQAVSRFVDSVMNNLSVLKRTTPELSTLEPETMFSAGISIPLHPAVTGYLKTRKKR
ncbi:MAG TPA: hypothetical protein DE312_06740 [Gallionella sp.]|nr:MAG: hypothetical protein A2Z87_12995 [Gallionellales bacterium GWA2_54_124]HCI52996.1 hypothetical protein [Gallionella sp.]